jgi:hypothetical protein
MLNSNRGSVVPGLSNVKDSWEKLAKTRTQPLFLVVIVVFENYVARACAVRDQ